MSYQSGMDAFKAGRYQEAADAFRECVESDEDNHKAWNSLGVVYTKTGHYEAADTCYENALSLAPGTAAYERNRDKNKAKIVEPVEDVLNVDDDEPKDWKIPGPEDKPKPSTKPTPSAKVTKTTPQYTIKQYAIAGLALIFLILIGAACVNMVGGGSSGHKQVQSQPVNVVITPIQTRQVTQQVTEVTLASGYDDDKLIKLLTISSDTLMPLMDSVTVDATNSDYKSLKLDAKKAQDQINEIIPVLNVLNVSPKYAKLKEIYLKTLNDLSYGYGSAYIACVAYEKGDLDEFNYQLKEATSGLEDGNKGLKDSSEEALKLAE